MPTMPSLPGAQMRIRRFPGEFLKLIKRTPVLENHRPAEIPEELGMQEAFFRMREQGPQHGNHGREDGNPFIEAPPSIDAHAYQENHEGLICLCRVATIKDF